jgi:hypothetical protein
MKLMTKTVAKSLPALGATDGQGDAAVARVKFFNPTGSFSWFASEYDPATGMFFGLVKGHETELGYFSLAELSAIRGRFGLGIERDLHFTPTTLGDLRKGRA